jgi:hypothetical protein
MAPEIALQVTCGGFQKCFEQVYEQWQKYVAAGTASKGFLVPLELRCGFCPGILLKLPCKVKGVPLHAMEALGVRGGIAPTHSQPWH